VPVLITNCHVSEKLKRGPVTAQRMMTLTAIKKAVELPVALVIRFATCSNLAAKPFFLNALVSIDIDEFKI
jgi:hypothetical protein